LPALLGEPFATAIRPTLAKCPDLTTFGPETDPPFVPAIDESIKTLE